MKLRLSLILCAIAAHLSLSASDIIITATGDTLFVNVIEISNENVKYKLEDDQEGPAYILNKDEMRKIVLANGKELVYNELNSNSIISNSTSERENYTVEERVRKYNATLYPQNNNTICIVEGSNKILRNKKALAYIELDFSDALVGNYDFNEKAFEYDMTLSEYVVHEYEEDEFDEYERNYVYTICNHFNNLMLLKKIHYISSPTMAKKSDELYKIVFHAKYIDFGNTALSAIFSPGKVGNAIVSGELYIYNDRTSQLICHCIVDRVKTAEKQSVRKYVRLMRALYDVFGMKLYYAKKKTNN